MTRSILAFLLISFLPVADNDLKFRSSRYHMEGKFFVLKRNWIPIVLPFILFLLHASLFGKWIIDDAGISFVYARNLAQGYGLVSQPGVPPVEGFSNPTWVLLLSPFFWLNIFDPILVPKTVSAILILATFIVISKILKLVTEHDNAGTFIVLAFLAINSSFVIWTTSGLENPLYAFLTATLLWGIIRIGHQNTNSGWYIPAVSLISIFIALTRPDGIVFAIAFPAILLSEIGSKRRSIQGALKPALIYSGIFLIGYGAYLTFRYAYFGDILPNTFYAKSGLGTLTISELNNKSDFLFQSISFSPLMYMALFAILVYADIDKKVRRSIFPVMLFLFLSIVVYFLLPSDWMPEFRFATPFFIFFHISLFAIVDGLSKNIAAKRNLQVLLFLCLFLFASANGVSFIKRTSHFSKEPTVPFTLVANLYGKRFDECASLLGISNASVLVPDIGGTLYYSNLRIYDLAGLTDKVIAKTLYVNPEKFHDYVFQTIKPTFIHIHQWWTYAASLDADSRFRQDYVAIEETIDPWIYSNFGERIYSGNYIRKDALKGRLDILQSKSIMKTCNPPSQ